MSADRLIKLRSMLRGTCSPTHCVSARSWRRPLLASLPVRAVRSQLTSTASSSSLRLQLQPACCYASGSGGRSSSRGSYRRRSSTSSSSSDPSRSVFSSPSLLVALLRSLPSAARARLLLGGGLLLAVCGGLVVVFVASLPYLIVPLVGVWLGRRMYCWWASQSSTSHSSPLPSAAASSSSSSASASPLWSLLSSLSSSAPWSSSLLSSLSAESALSSVSHSVDSAISAAIQHPRVRSLLGADGSSDESVVDEAVAADVVSQQVRVVDGRLSGALVVQASNVRTGRGVQLSIEFEREPSDGSASDAVRLTRLTLRLEGSQAVEELSVDGKGSPKRSSADDVIDVQYDVTSEQQRKSSARK